MQQFFCDVWQGVFIPLGRDVKTLVADVRRDPRLLLLVGLFVAAIAALFWLAWWINDLNVYFYGRGGY